MAETRKWIFLRGLGRHSGHWGNFLQFFHHAFPSDEIELLEIRGNGSLAHSTSWRNVRDNVRDLRARSRFLEQGHSVCILSLSLGSMIAVEWAKNFPEEVSALVTINTSDRGNSPWTDRMKPLHYLDVVKLLRGSQSQLDKEKCVLKAARDYFIERNQIAPDFQSFPRTSKTNFLRQLFTAAIYEFPTQRPKTEILILCSKGDRLVSSECSKRIAKMWILKPLVHPTAGHDLPLDDPQWICDQLTCWPVLKS